MSDWTIMSARESTNWRDAIREACKTLVNDETLEVVALVDVVGKSCALQHARNTLAKFPSLNAQFRAVMLVNDDDERSAGIARIDDPDAANAADEA